MWIKVSDDEWHFICPASSHTFLMVEVERDFDLEGAEEISSQTVYCRLEMLNGEDDFIEIAELPRDRVYHVTAEHRALALEKCKGILQDKIDQLVKLQGTFAMHLELTSVNGGKEEK